MLPSDFSLLHAVAIILIVVCWFGYSRLLATIARGSLNSQLAFIRQDWIKATTQRPGCPFDAIMLGHIVNALAFFGSGTLLVLAGMISTFAGAQSIHATLSELHFIAPASLELFALLLGLLTLVIALCFFSFTYALRKLTYTIALVAALPEDRKDCPAHDAMVEAASLVLSEAIKTFNFGIRGYYYAIAALCLIASPVASIIASLLVTAILLYRQLATPTARAIRDYVEAAGRGKG